jgi:hypothetical protein
MRRKLLVLLAVVAVLAAMVAAPVSAKEKPISGKMELDFQPQPAFCFDREGEIIPVTWTGTVVIDGTTYGWADFPTGPFVIEGNFGYFEEYWTIFTLGPDDDPNDLGVACDWERVLIDGSNEGWGPAMGNTGKADGTVDNVYADDVPFADVAIGSRMMWRGKVTAPGEFKATFHIFPLK